MGDTDEQDRHKSALRRGLQIAFAIAIVVAVFAAVIPSIADYGQVWAIVSGLTAFQLAMLLSVSLLNLVTYWLQSVAAQPGMTVRQAAVVTQTSTTIANTMPAGGAVGVGIQFAMLRSWGFSDGEVARYVLVTGIWNTFIKLGLPVIAVGLLVLEGRTNPGLVTATAIGVATLVGAIVVLWLILWRETAARRIGDLSERVVSGILRLVRRDPVTGWGDAAVRFRSDTIDLLTRRWIWLTLTTVVSHLALYLVLLASLRVLGIDQGEVSWIEALGVFALGRLVTAIPITPGGLGVVELSYIGGLVWAGAGKADAVAAVLLFRALTYGLQLPLGAITYPIWQRTKDRWHRVDEDDRQGEGGSSIRDRVAAAVTAGDGS